MFKGSNSPVDMPRFKNCVGCGKQLRDEDEFCPHCHMKQPMELPEFNILFVGPKGCGKSATINAFFYDSLAPLGDSTESQTVQCKKYVVGPVIAWDTSGFMLEQKDHRAYSKMIKTLLTQKNQYNQFIIDIIAVIMDAQDNNFRAIKKIIEILLQNLDKDRHHRIVLALNKCDMALGGHGFDFKHNYANDYLELELHKKIDTIKSSMKKYFDLDFNTTFHSALIGGNQDKIRHYNIHELHSSVIHALVKTNDYYDIAKSFVVLPVTMHYLRRHLEVGY